MPDHPADQAHRLGKLAAWGTRRDVRWLLIFVSLDGGWLAGHLSLALVS